MCVHEDKQIDGLLVPKGNSSVTIAKKKKDIHTENVVQNNTETNFLRVVHVLGDLGFCTNHCLCVKDLNLDDIKKVCACVSVSSCISLRCLIFNDGREKGKEKAIWAEWLFSLYIPEFCMKCGFSLTPVCVLTGVCARVCVCIWINVTVIMYYL